MKHLSLLSCLVLLPCAAAPAAPPSLQSVNELIELSQAQRMHATIAQQQEAMAKVQIEQIVKTPSPEAQPAMEAGRAKILGAIRKAYDWEALRETYIEVYRENFTQEEIDGMIAFYRSPAGKALNERMGPITQRIVTVMSQRMSVTMGEVIRSFQEQRRTSQETAMRNNAKMLRAAADQHFRESGGTSVPTAKIVGPGTYIKVLKNVAGETYPETIEKEKPIVIRKADGSELRLD